MIFDLNRTIKTFAKVGATGLGAIVVGELAEYPLVSSLGYVSLASSVVGAATAGVAGVIYPERPESHEDESPSNYSIEKLGGYSEPEEKLERYKARCELRDFRAERFKKRAMDYAEGIRSIKESIRE